jgi:hypothetical protein
LSHTRATAADCDAAAPLPQVDPNARSDLEALPESEWHGRISLRVASPKLTETASLLNASHSDVDFAYSAAEVVAAVNAVVSTNPSRGVLLALAATLDAENNERCPLN